MSKSSLDGYITGEHLPKISESKILELSKKPKLDINSGISNSSTKLIHTMSAACKKSHIVMKQQKKQEPNCFLSLQMCCINGCTDVHRTLGSNALQSKAVNN